MREILADLEATKPDNDAGKRLQALFCKSIEDAIHEITRANGDPGG